MNKYKKLKEKHQKEFSLFPIFFAFNKTQFDEGMKTLGLDPTEIDKLFRSSSGSFYKKTDSQKLNEMLVKQRKELSDSMKKNKFLFDAFNYELSNHEYCYTWDNTDALNALNFTLEEVNKDKRMLKILNKACGIQLCKNIGDYSLKKSENNFIKSCWRKLKTGWAIIKKTIK